MLIKFHKIKRLIKWLFWEPRSVWISLLFPFSLFYFLKLFWETSCTIKIHYFAGIMQLAGLCCTILGFFNLIKDLNKPTLKVSFKKWIQRCPCKRRYVDISCTASFTTISSPSLSVDTRRKNLSINNRVYYLEKKVEEHRKILLKLENNNEYYENILGKEKKERIKENRKIHKFIQNTFGEKLHWEFIGIFWLIISVIFSYFSPELQCLWHIITRNLNYLIDIVT